MPISDTLLSEAWLWLGGSLLLAVFWTNLAQLYSPWVTRGKPADDASSLAERIVIQVATWRFASALFRVLRLLYYVGLPLAALLWGYDAVVSRFLGLQRLMLPTSSGAHRSALVSANWLDWLHDLGWTAAVGLGSAALLLAAGWARRRALPTTGGGDGGSRASSWGTAREALYHEIHWSFYRNAPIVTFGSYWGVWAGLGLTALEAIANPAWRERFSDPVRAPAQLLHAALAVTSSALFLQTQNLWLAVLLHWAVSWGLHRLYSAHRTADASDMITGRSTPPFTAPGQDHEASPGL
jgi:hypothetical protein